MPETASREPKYFVLDTNVLLHTADAITSFADNVVVIPIWVLEELDRFKSHNDELGRNARTTSRLIDRLRSKGMLKQGVPMENGGRLLIIAAPPQNLSGEGLAGNTADNYILGTALKLKNEGKRVVFVSKDINARIKGDALGIRSVDFEKQHIGNIDELYKGWREVFVGDKQVDMFYSQKHVEHDVSEFYANEFVLLKDNTNPKHSALGRVRKEEGRIAALSKASEHTWNIQPRNMEQRMALELLLDDKVKLVTLVGRAGTGKTLLALAAALQRCLQEKRYERILVSRPIMPLGKDIGYLPGSKEEKLSSWMMPIFDNLDFLLSGKTRHIKESADDLIEQGIIELEALTYIRGRSIPNQYVIVDEAQNLTPHEVKTVISRAGMDTKMVLTGDPYQIDNPYLDSASNGLSYAADRLKTSPLHGHVILTSSERSPLASLAAESL
ncbi:MAG TPA: PhoH family protein [Planctomycetes bacterium]|nr:PhoH family protein [Planctomycetota bacterium]